MAVHSDPGPRTPDLFGWVVRTGVGLALLSAAWLKAAGNPAGVLLSAGSWLGLPFMWLLVVVVTYELLLAVWLISGPTEAASSSAARIRERHVPSATSRAPAG